MLQLRWRPRAQLDRESIAIYLGVERRSPQAALNAMAVIDKALSFIRQFPDSGGFYQHDHLDREYRTMLADPYIVYYRYDAEYLTVYRILHQRQDIDVYTLIDLD